MPDRDFVSGLAVDAYANGALVLLIGEHTYILSDKLASRDVFSCFESLAFGSRIKCPVNVQRNV